jgi:hypothetical protein
MTEAEWLKCDNPAPMLESLPGASSRKLRLFAVAGCRRLGEHLADDRSRRAVETAEAFADRGATRAELGAALRSARQARHDAQQVWSRAGHPDYGPTYVALVAAEAAEDACAPRPIHAATGAFQGCPPAAAGGRNRVAGRRRETVALAALLRDVLGNLFRPVAYDRAWRTSTAVELARLMYEGRDFSPMPILADALQDAGCANDDVLGHCRSDGPHVRGCWVVDLLLGKG